MASGYSVLFDDGASVTTNKRSGLKIANVHMTQNEMFLLEVSTVKNLALVAGVKNDSKLWHLRYGHLNN